MRKCSKCREMKSLAAFGKDTNRSGLRYVCRECHNAIARQWNHANPEKTRALAAQWRARNAKRHAANNKEWKKRNPGRNTANVARRTAKKEQATPSWLTAIQLAQIQEFYEIAAARTMQTGIIHHVDHIHPLVGKNFRGLHVPWNLQVLTAAENLSKGARLQW